MKKIGLCLLLLLPVPCEAKIADILFEGGLPWMNVSFSSKDLVAQEKKWASRVNGHMALAQALQALLHDDSSPETPLELFTQEGMNLVKGLNRSSAKLELFGKEGTEFLKPEYGEKVEENWIFVLSLPEFSDHLFWVVVDRSGSKEAYVYGFN